MTRDERSWRTVRPFLVGIFLFSALALFNDARGLNLWRNYALSGVFLGSGVVWALWNADVRVPAYIQWVIIGALGLHYGGGSLAALDGYHMGLLGTHGVNGAYHVFEWWDNLTHGVGIFAAGMAYAYLLELYQLRRGLGWTAPQVGVVAVLCALTTGVGVELYEFLGKTLFQTIDQGGYANTMTDLQFNLLGAALGAALAATVNRARFAAAIKARYPTPVDPTPLKVPPGMRGFLVFVSIPALATVYLILRFMGQEVSAQEDLALYDEALILLTQAAGLAVILGPATAMVSREMRRRSREAPA